MVRCSVAVQAISCQHLCVYIYIYLQINQDEAEEEQHTRTLVLSHTDSGVMYIGM